MATTESKKTNEIWNMQLKDMEDLLSSLSKGARDLASLDDEEGAKSSKKKKVVVLDEEQKRQKSSSSWARSRVPNTASFMKKKSIEKSQDLNVEKAVNVVRTAIPSYSFPKSAIDRKVVELSGDISIPGPQSYIVNDIKLSSRKRPAAAAFGKEKREVFKVDGDSPNPTKEDDEYDIVEEEYIISNGPSFPKAKRFSEEKPETEPDVESSPMDIEKAEKALLPNTPGPLMRPKTAPAANRRSQGEEMSEIDLRKQIDAPPRLEVDALSTYYRTPGVKIYSEPKKETKRTKDDEISERLLGPGCYSVNDRAIRFTSKNEGMQSGARIYVDKEHKKIPHAIANKMVESFLNDKRGPGYYNPATSVVNSQHIPVMKFQYPSSESKLTKQQEKKKYFEEKHSSAKGETILKPNDSYFHAKVPVVNFDLYTGRSASKPRSRSLSRDGRTPNSSRYPGIYSDDSDEDEAKSYGGESKSSSFSPRRIQFAADGTLFFSKRERRSLSPTLQKQKKLMPSRDLSYNVKYDFVEKRVTTGLSMKSEIVARERTKELIKQKPNAIQAIDEKQKTPTPNKFYGPQLQVPWVPDKDSMKPEVRQKLMKKRGKSENNIEDDDGEESPSEEILQMLADRNRNDQERNPKDNQEFTEAFLKSSYSGSLLKKPPTVHLDSNDPTRRSILANEKDDNKDLEFIGPQLQIDWTKPEANKSARYKQPAVEFNKLTSRDKIKVHAKGIVEKEEFSNSKIAKTDDFGPGKYDTMSKFEISKAKPNNVISFDKHISRKDQIGAHGEKPESALDNDHLDTDEELEMNGELDIDYGKAKDLAQRRDKVKGIPLYTKDRYPVEGSKKRKKRTVVNEDGEEIEIEVEEDDENPLNEHLGGSWFQGMAEEVKKKSNKHIDFSRMRGRKDLDKDEEDQLYEKEIQKEMDVDDVNAPLDLEVKDYQPNKPKTTNIAIQFTDPKKDPRLLNQEKSKYYKEKELTEEDIRKDQEKNDNLLFNKKKQFVNMNKMGGRNENNQEEKDMVNDLIHGEYQNDDEALELEKAKSKAIEQYEENKYGKPLVKNIDFNKQNNSQREKDNRKLQELEEEVIKEGIDETKKNYQAYEDPDIHEKKKISNYKNDLIKFDRMKGRRDDENEKNVMNEELKDQESEELDLDPKKTEFLSNQKRVKGMVDFNKQKEKKSIKNDSIYSLDPNIPAEEFKKKDGEILDLEGIDGGNFKKGLHPIDNAKNYPKMKNQLIPRNDEIEQKYYAEEIQKELGVIDNPHPNQPMVILETNNKDILKPRSKGITSMNEKGISGSRNENKENDLMEEEIMKEYQDYDQSNNHRQGSKLIVNPNLDGKNTQSSKQASNPDQPNQGGLKNVTAMQQKSRRFEEDIEYEKEITKQINREYDINLPLDERNQDQGRILILGPAKNPMKDVTEKNQGISTMKKQSNNEYYHENSILKKEIYQNQEEVKLFENIDSTQMNRNSVKGSAKTTTTRMPTKHEENIIKELDDSLQEEVMIDQMRLSSSIQGGVRNSQKDYNPMSRQSQGRRSTDNKNNSAENAQEEIILSNLVNQSSDKQLRKSLQKNENQFSQGELIILDDSLKSKGNKNSSIRNITTNKSNRLESSYEKEINEQFIRDSTEELILHPNGNNNNHSKKVSALASKEPRLPTYEEMIIEKEFDKDYGNDEIQLDSTKVNHPTNGNSMKRNLSNVSTMKNTTEKTKTTSEMKAEKEFQKTLDEANINAKNNNNSKNTKTPANSNVNSKTSFGAAKSNKSLGTSSQTQTKKGEPVANNSRRPSTSSAGSIKGKSAAKETKKEATKQPQQQPAEEEAEDEEELIIQTPVLHAPTISAKTPVIKESFQNLQDKFSELNI